MQVNWGWEGVTDGPKQKGEPEQPQCPEISQYNSPLGELQSAPGCLGSHLYSLCLFPPLGPLFPLGPWLSNKFAYPHLWELVIPRPCCPTHDAPMISLSLRFPSVWARAAAASHFLPDLVLMPASQILMSPESPFSWSPCTCKVRTPPQGVRGAVEVALT